MFDATSPVSAEAKFNKVHDRRKQGYYCDEYLDSWRQVLEENDVALQLWQTSHVGDPTNEWADAWRLPRALKRCCRSCCAHLATSRCGRLARCARGKRLVGHGWGGSCPKDFRRA